LTIFVRLRDLPGLASKASTTQSRSAFSTFSIFIASSIKIGSPSSTLSPIFFFIFKINPGIGALTSV
jgi:hypothetical protein